MYRRDYLRLAGVTSALVAGTTTATAQESPTPTETETESTPTEDSADVVEQDPTYLARVDPTTRVVDYRVENDSDDEATVVVELETDAPTIVTMSDPFGGLVQEGVTSVETKETSVPRGDVEVSMRTTVWEEETTALGLATPRGQVVISTGLPDDKAPETSLWRGTAAGMTTMTLGTGLAAYRRVKNQKDDPEDAVTDGGGLLK